MFDSSVTVALRDGLTPHFWTNSWLPEGTLMRLAPHLFAVVPKRRHVKSISEAIANRSWVRDVQGVPAIEVLCDYVYVWEKVDGILLHNTSDRFV
jgi:hypothetical protein